jgi:hypothetical protein
MSEVHRDRDHTVECDVMKAGARKCVVGVRMFQYVGTRAGVCLGDSVYVRLYGSV